MRFRLDVTSYVVWVDWLCLCPTRSVAPWFHEGVNENAWPLHIWEDSWFRICLNRTTFDRQHCCPIARRTWVLFLVRVLFTHLQKGKPFTIHAQNAPLWRRQTTCTLALEALASSWVWVYEWVVCVPCDRHITDVNDITSRPSIPVYVYWKEKHPLSVR